MIHLIPSEQENKICTKCKIEQNLESFAKRKNGYHSWCNSCKKQYEAKRREDPEIKAKILDSVKQYSKQRWQQSSEVREKQRNKQLLEKFNLTSEQYEEMLTAQGGVCKICEKVDSIKLAVDHCHSSGKIRGLLCGSCNRALGLFKDNKSLLQKALDYLKD